MSTEALAVGIVAIVLTLMFSMFVENGNSFLAKSDPFGGVVCMNRAAGPPTLNDDILHGYVIGCVWVDTSSLEAYIAVSVIGGAADWNRIDDVNVAAGTQHGGLFATDTSASAQTLDTADVFEVLEEMNQEGLSTAGISISTANNNITVNSAGIYLVLFSVSWSGTNNKDYHIALFLDGVLIPGAQIHRKLGTGGDVGAVGANSIVNISNGGVIDLRAAPENNGDTITVFGGSITVLKLP